tara:strand:- start:282 stop:509 length:228 start_codon:yes stop_codon:yes gene_type:complete
MEAEEIPVESVCVDTTTVAKRQIHRIARRRRECTVTRKDPHAKITSYFLVLSTMEELLTTTIFSERLKMEKKRKE